MKRIYLYIAAMLLLASSCVKEEISYRCSRVEEGLPASVTLRYKVQHRDVVTRAAQASRYEYQVNNLYVFVFDASGQKFDYEFFTPSTGFNPSNNESEAYGEVEMDTKSLNDATIVGIANVTVEEGADMTSTAYYITAEQLDAVETLDELKQLVMPLSESDRESWGRSALFMMTGYAKDGAGNTTVTIPATEGQGTTNLDCTLALERTDAKVQFVVVSEKPGDKNWEDFSFTPKNWSIHEVPQQSLLLPADAGVTPQDADGEGCTYFSTLEMPFETLTVDENNLSTGGGFVFYMAENKKEPKKEAGNYSQRDDSETTIDGVDDSKPGQEYRNTDFAYAHAHSTYVVLTGTVSYMDRTDANNPMAVNADVRYIIHLGNASDANPNDYDTKRNVHYTYTVKVMGVNDIVVEVEEKDEVRAGHEGDVVYSANEIFEFDSHYDRKLISIPRSLISANMTWSVKTPFSSGLHDPEKSEVEDALKDYQWIKFAINQDYNTSSDQYVKYPGDQNYKGGDNQPSGYNEHLTDARLLDVQQLIERLQSAVNNEPDLFEGNENRVYITAFVDENLYITNPLTGETPTTAQGHYTLWKECVDQDDRLLHIVTDDAYYSPDGNSSVVNSLYTFKQKAIRTVFNVQNEALETAWGLESVMETERLRPGTVSQGNSSNNGRENTLKWLNSNLTWTDVLYTENNAEHALREAYNTAAYACLLRNRDLNGNNVIDPEEVRWYLAAIDQLTDIYIGEYALDADSRLYPGADAIAGLGGRTPYWHYTSSSSDNGNPWVFWAEEGASRGSYGNSVDLNGSFYAYRCIRNLGLPLDKPDEVPEDLIECDGNGDGTYTMDLSKLNPKALRSYSDGRENLPAHDERDADNLPRIRFMVDDETRNSEGDAPRYSREWDWTSWNYYFANKDFWYVYQDAPNACPPGYRVPNQRELLIMSTRMPDDAWTTYSYSNRSSKDYKIMCQTAFSMNGDYGYTGRREGFMWSAGNGVFMLQNDRSEEDSGYVRCVRDLQ